MENNQQNQKEIKPTEPKKTKGNGIGKLVNIFQSKQFSELESMTSKTLFIMINLIQKVNNDHIPADTVWIRNKTFPYDEYLPLAKIRESLLELESKKFIEKIEIDGHKYIKYQYKIDNSQKKESFTKVTANQDIPPANITEKAVLEELKNTINYPYDERIDLVFTRNLWKEFGHQFPMLSVIKLWRTWLMDNIKKSTDGLSNKFPKNMRASLHNRCRLSIKFGQVKPSQEQKTEFIKDNWKNPNKDL
jgi:hypothetical protein